ncbi:hypothetical protein [Streptomyces chartreusis]
MVTASSCWEYTANAVSGHPARWRAAAARRSGTKALRAIALLNTDHYRHLYAGILCTIDVRNDPEAVYDAPPIDFLLPHATWDEPPLRPDGIDTPHADWLLTIHHRWSEQGRPMPVRLFNSVVSTLGGCPGFTEALKTTWWSWPPTPPKLLRLVVAQETFTRRARRTGNWLLRNFDLWFK